MTRLTPGCPDQPRNFTGILHTYRHYTRQCPMHVKPGHQNNKQNPNNRNHRQKNWFDLENLISKPSSTCLAFTIKLLRQRWALLAFSWILSRVETISAAFANTFFRIIITIVDLHNATGSLSTPFEYHLNSLLIQSYLKSPSESPLKRNAGTV